MLAVVVRRGGWMLGLLGLLAIACAARADEMLIDEGEACVTVRSGGAHQVEVDAGICLSSSCDELVSATCTVTLEDRSLTVASEFTVRRNGKGVCTADCGSAMARCLVPAVADGTYSLVYGGAFVGLTIPVDPAMPTCISAR